MPRFINPFANFRERALFYLSHTITRQGERGADWLFDLKAVYGVFFMNFRLENMAHKLRTDVILADRDTHEQFSDKLRFIFIELPSFTKEEADCDTDFDRWIYVLKNMETLKRLPFKARKAVFQKLEKIVDIASLTKEEREKYDESIKVYRDHLATLAYAEQKGRQEGIHGHTIDENMIKKLSLIRTTKATSNSSYFICNTIGLLHFTGSIQYFNPNNISRFIII